MYSSCLDKLYTNNIRLWQSQLIVVLYATFTNWASALVAARAYSYSTGPQVVIIIQVFVPHLQSQGVSGFSITEAEVLTPGWVGSVFFELRHATRNIATLDLNVGIRRITHRITTQVVASNAPHVYIGISCTQQRQDKDAHGQERAGRPHGSQNTHAGLKHWKKLTQREMHLWTTQGTKQPEIFGLIQRWFRSGSNTHRSPRKKGDAGATQVSSEMFLFT